MPLPTISILTPSLNQAAFLRNNIESIRSQSYPSVEHFVIDGGSTDGTLEILKSYPDVRWISEPDSGQAHALNKGLRQTHGEIIGWLNADDEYCPGALNRIAELFSRPDVMAVYGDGIEIDAEGTQLREIKPRGITAVEFIRYWRWKYDYAQPAFFFRRSVFDVVGPFDESLHYVMDHELFIRLLLQYKCTYVGVPLAKFRLHASSKTGRNAGAILPSHVWELHRVSRRFWGSPMRWIFYSHALSFGSALLLSALKNLLVLPGSKLSRRLRRS